MLPNGPTNRLECDLAARFNEIGIEADDMDKQDWQKFLTGKATLYVRWNNAPGVVEKTVGLLEGLHD